MFFLLPFLAFLPICIDSSPSITSLPVPQPSTQIHTRMSASDLQQTFQVHSHDEVPEYDVVHLRVKTKRSADDPQDVEHKQVYLKAFGQEHHLNLRPNEEFNRKLEHMKLFGAETRTGGHVKYVEMPSESDETLGRTYHDDDNFAAILVRRTNDGKLLMDGTIGDSLVIKPLPLTMKVPSHNPDFMTSEGPPFTVDPGLIGRDDDEMFLEEDDVSVKDLSHLKKKPKSLKKYNIQPEKKPWTKKGAVKGVTSSTLKSHKGSILFDGLNLTSQPKSNLPIMTSPLSSSSLPPSSSAPASASASTTHTLPLYDSSLHAHVVFKRKVHSDKPHSDFAHLEPDHLTFSSSSPGSFPVNWTLVPTLSSSHQVDPMAHMMGSLNGSTFAPITSSSSSSHHGHRRSKRQSPDTVWPEVLLVVDYDSYLLHGGNSRDVKRYFISFWNGVDLRYKLLSHPRIRVSLAGMIVAKDRDATPYLERNRLRAPNADAVDAAGALTDMGKYLYREDRLPTYDLAVVITKLDMCRRRYEGGRCNRGTAGFAYVGGACVVNKRLEKVNSVAIIEDSGGFSGIIVAAHEVGHLLGCVHDGSPPPSYLGGPGATRCPWEDGFIMSDLRHTERGFRWSSCSVEQFKHFLNGETATCLYNYPHENQLLPRVLPGTMLTLDEQCKRDRGTNACFKDARVCAQLFCFDSASGYCVSYRPAAEGSSCGDGQVCRNGKCTAELENIIPDYTHVTQTVVTRGGPDRLLARSDSFVGNNNPNQFTANSNTEESFNPLDGGSPHNSANSLTMHPSLPMSPEDSSNQRSPRAGFRSRSNSFSSRSDEGPTDPLSVPSPSFPPPPPQYPSSSSSPFNSPPSSSSPVSLPNSPPSSQRRKHSCRDIIEKMSGSLSCSDFLERFGYRYCNHSYVKRNCCASHAIICNKASSMK